MYLSLHQSLHRNLIYLISLPLLELGLLILTCGTLCQSRKDLLLSLTS